jgi:hypothetical protein
LIEGFADQQQMDKTTAELETLKKTFADLDVKNQQIHR